MAIKCEQCGAALTEGDGKFCKYCGAKLPEEVKEDKKRREYRFEFSSDGSTRRAEIRKEREAQKLEHQRQIEKQRQEFVEKQTKAQAESDKALLKILVFVVGAFALLYILTKIF